MNISLDAMFFLISWLFVYIPIMIWWGNLSGQKRFSTFTHLFVSICITLVFISVNLILNFGTVIVGVN